MTTSHYTPHVSGFPKVPCRCFPKIIPGVNSIIPDELHHHEEFVEEQLTKAILDNSPMTSLCGGFKICGAYNNSFPPTLTALYIECQTCKQIWCYDNEKSLRKLLEKKENAFAGKKVLALTEELDRILDALKSQQTLIDILTRWSFKAN